MLISLNNNKLKYIHNDRDITDIIKEDLSEELAYIIEKKITQKTIDEMKAEQLANSDFRAYESENEVIGTA